MSRLVRRAMASSTARFNGVAGAGPVEVDQVQAAQAGIGEALGYGHGVGIVGGLTGKVAGAEPDALAIDEVNGGNNFHGGKSKDKRD